MASEKIHTDEQTHFRTCNLCEAMCGIEIKHDGVKVLSMKGDKDDPFSKGYICPKRLLCKTCMKTVIACVIPLRERLTVGKRLAGLRR